LKVVGPKRYSPLNTKKLSPSHLEIYWINDELLKFLIILFLLLLLFIIIY
jgi:hypothetical protein